MKVYILDDYYYDCEVYPEDTVYTPYESQLYEVPDDLVKEYEAINNRRDELKEKLLLIKRQWRLAELANPVDGVKPKGFN